MGAAGRPCRPALRPPLPSKETAARHACTAAIKEAIADSDLEIGGRGWEKTRAAIVERLLTEPSAGGRWLDRVHAERLHTWTTPRNKAKAALHTTALPLICKPVSATDNAFALLRWFLGKASEGLPLTDRYYIVPRLVTEAVEVFGWRDHLVGVLTREFDVFPLQTIRDLTHREMKAVRRTGRRFVLTPRGRRMLADHDQLGDAAFSCLIGQGHAFTTTTREIILALLVTGGAMPEHDIDRKADEILRQEWNSPGGLADPVRDERLDLRHRLWALDCHLPARRLDTPFALTSDGITAARAALRAHALRPRFTLGFG